MGTILNNKRFFPNYSQIMVTYQFGGNHYGIDLVAFDGKSTRVDKIMAHDGGTVSFIGFDTYAGYIVEITVDDVYVERYQHLAKDSITVKIGEQVKAGRVIAYMGDTGVASQGAHLHFAIRENGNYIDPQPYLDKDVKKAVTPTTNSLKAGTKYNLNNVKIYQSPDAKTESGRMSGTYYVWSEQVDLGRIRMTNRLDRVGVAGQVSFFVNVSDLGASTSTPTVSATTNATEDYTKSTIPNRFRVMLNGVQKGAYQTYTYAVNYAKSINGIVADSLNNMAQIYPTVSAPKPTVQTTTTKPTTTATKSLKAGTKYTLNNVKVYNSDTTKVDNGTRSGVYYVWSDTVNNGRIRMTNKPERVGVAGQVSFFVNTSDLK